MRKYDDGNGRFTSIDPDWEKYRSLSPYNYAENNPLVLKDPSGFGPGLGGAFDIQPSDIATGGMLGVPSGGGGVGLGQVIGAAVAAITGYIFAENTVGADKEQQAPPPPATAPVENKTPKSIPEQAQELKKQNGGKNTVTIETPEKKIHYDLDGTTHRGVPTPHIQYSYPNTDSETGETHWNKDRKTVKPMDQKDIEIVKKYLEKQKQKQNQNQK